MAPPTRIRIDGAAPAGGYEWCAGAWLGESLRAIQPISFETARDTRLVSGIDVLVVQALSAQLTSTVAAIVGLPVLQLAAYTDGRAADTLAYGWFACAGAGAGYHRVTWLIFTLQADEESTACNQRLVDITGSTGLLIGGFAGGNDRGVDARLSLPDQRR
jgi:hypothetical protein